MIWPFRRDHEPPPEEHQPSPTPEALKEAAELARLKPRVESAARERDRLMQENNYTARIRALYLEGRA